MSKPRYALIADDIRDKIRTGEYAPGAKLPTSAQLMEQWSVALNTVGRALEELRNEGLVSTYHGVGSFVSEEPEPRGNKDTEAELRARVEQLEAQMMEVYSNIGLAYPGAPAEHGKGTAREAM